MLPLWARLDLEEIGSEEVGTPHSPKLQNWSLTIRLFSVICRTLVGVAIHPCRDAVDILYSPSWLSCFFHGRGLTPLQVIQSIYSKPHQQSIINKVCLKSTYPFWMSREPVVEPWYNLETNQRILYSVCMNRQFPIK